MRISARNVSTIVFFWVAEEAFLNLLGTKDMIPEVAKILVPIIGASAATIVVLMAIGFLREWDKASAGKVVSDLQSFIYAGEKYFSGFRDKRIPREDMHRFNVLGRKYPDLTSIADKTGKPSWTPNSIHRATFFSEIFRAHGYIKGRIKIWQERRQVSKK